MNAIALIAIVVYAILVAVGGAIGFLKSNSKISLISGLGSAAVLIVARIVASNSPSAGLGIALACAIVLAIVFAVRLRKTKKLMPAGVMIVASAIAAVLFAVALV
ncbi:TMEM14 family protein [Synechococcus sp. PCC 7336]|uniref:TMEM14 family protein n=1 Tax=Synechococcus sp. PCC 7336 TaxID=195250 RepID=UPI00034BEAAB|nr:TMEM14 family protein [Synechococcus sp. PCC 7336]